MTLGGQILNFVFIGLASALIGTSMSISGLTSVVPLIVFVAGSIVILIFTVLQTGDALFQLGSFELLLTMPVEKVAIIISRFIYMYVSNFFWGAVIALPAMIAVEIIDYGGIVGLICMLIGIIALPMIPMTIGVLIGSFITAHTAKMKHGKSVSALISIAVAVPAMLLWIGFNYVLGQGDAKVLEHITEAVDIWVTRVYPPAIWFGKACQYGDFLNIVLLLGVSAVIFAIMVYAVQKNYVGICSAVNSNSAKKDYKMESLEQTSILNTLIIREWKHYVSSSAYINNTLFFYIIMVIMAAAMLLLGPEKVGEITGFYNLQTIFPLVVAFWMALAPMTAYSISIEGKQWWILQTLPVDSCDIYKSKLLINVIVASPFYLATMIMGYIAVRPGFLFGLAGILVSLSLFAFNIIFGLNLNIKNANIDWDEEKQVMKGNPAILWIMLTNLLTWAVPLVLTLIFSSHASVIMLATSVILLTIAGIILKKIYQKPLIKIT